MTANTPKDPIDGVTEWINEETGIKYRYISGAWRAVSSKAAQDVADALGQLDLQKVLDNGNVADKGAEFGGPVIIERNAGDSTTLNVKGGIRNDEGEVVVGSMLRAYHDKNDLTKDSGVEYKGKIYNENNLVNKGYVDATDDLQTAAISDLQGSVLVLQQEIEQLSKVQDTGKWVYTNEAINPRASEFTLIANTGLNTVDWDDAINVIISETDISVEVHSFDSWEEDDTIEIFNTTTNTFALYTLGPPGNFGFELKGVQRSKGRPINGAEYEIRVIKIETGIDLNTADERYVQKTGDQMSGVLETTRPIWIRPGTGAAKGVNNMLVVNQVNPGPGGGSIARFQQDGKDVIKVQVDKVTSFEHNRIEKVADPEEDKDAANKEYVDTEISDKIQAAIDALPDAPDGDFLPLSGGTMTGTLNMGDQWISRVKTPTASHEATNRQYVDSKVNERLKMTDTAYPILWQYKQGVSASALENGQFTINDKGGTTHVVDIYFAERDAYGRRLWASNNDNSYSHELGNQMMSIRDYMDICYQGKTMKWYMGETNGTSHLYTSYGKFNYALNNNKVYMIFIPGIMPAYRFPGSWYNGQGKVPTAFELPEEKPEPLDIYYPGDDATSAEDTGTTSSGY